MKKKLKRFGLFLVFSLPIFYFLFTIFFFSPFEDDYGRIDHVVPRQVDFFISKGGLKNDFRNFPVPTFYSEMEIRRDWRVFAKTPLYSKLSAQMNLGQMVDDIRNNLEQIPYLDVLEDLIGENVMMVANLKPGAQQSLTGLVFLRISWKIKLAYELMLWDLARGFSGDPQLKDSTIIKNPDGYVTLILADNQQFYMKREADLLVFGDNEPLMQQVCDLHNAGNIDMSIAEGKGYKQKVSAVDRKDTNYLDFYTDMGKLLDQVTWDEALQANNQDFSVMVAADVFNPEFFRSLAGALHMDRYLDLKAKLDFFTEKVDAAKTGFFGLDSFSLKERMDFLTNMLPRDTILAASVKMDLKHLLKIMERSLDRETKEFIESMIREGRRFNRKWDVSALWNFIDRLDATFGDMIYFAMRARRADKPLAPMVQPVPIIALMLEIKNMDHFLNMEKTLVEMQNNNKTKFEVWHFKEMTNNCDIKGVNLPGADDIEQIVYTVLDNRYFILTTSSEYIKEMLYNNLKPDQGLKVTKAYQPAAQLIKGHGNFACFLNVDSFKGELENYGKYWAEINSYLDFETIRKKERADVVRREFPRYANMEKAPPNIETRIEARVDQRIEQLKKKRIDVEIPRLTKQFIDNLAWLDLINSVTLTLNVNRNDLDLDLRVRTFYSK